MNQSAQIRWFDVRYAPESGAKADIVKDPISAISSIALPAFGVRPTPPAVGRLVRPIYRAFQAIAIAAGLSKRSLQRLP
jgi:hypothetical protein